MKVLHVIENVDERYGGPAKTVPFLCDNLKKIGVDVSINSVKKYDYESNAIILSSGLKWNNFENSVTDTLRYSFGLYRGLEKQVKGDQQVIIHTHNQWNFPPYCAFKLSKKLNLPLVCSIHGSMYPWSLSQFKWFKKFFWLAFQKRMFQEASCVHATEPGELKAIRDLGITSPIALISNGIELSEFENMPTKSEACAKLGISETKKYILFISRIHPVKGLDFLARALADNSSELSDWELLIAGPTDDDKFLREVNNIFDKSGLTNKIHFLGMLNHADRILPYAASSLFVLPSHTENFGIVIAEAMAARIPVITTKNTPWSEIQEHNCGWWVDLSDENISKALLTALKSSTNELMKKGLNGRSLVVNNYSWDIQAEKTAKLYHWLASGGEKPDFVDVM